MANLSTCALCAIVLVLLFLIPSGRVGAQSGPALPAGFRADVYVNGLQQPTSMAFGPDNRLYVAQENGRIFAIGNHRVVLVASGFNTPLGLAWYRGLLYVSSMGRVSTLSPSHSFSRFTRRDIVTGLPFGEHQNDSIAFHDGWMYLSVGSTCDACVERDPRSATVMRFYANGSHAQIVAHGLRNPYGLAFRPGKNQLYATDNGRDDHDDQVPDELNHVISGGNYGWPDCWGNGGGTNCHGTIPPVASLEAHASADGLTFYTGRSFPARYRGDAFIAEWGQDVGVGSNGRRVKDVHFAGNRVIVSDFATGLIHPIAVIGARDGSLLIADFGVGIIWHVQAQR